MCQTSFISDIWSGWGDEDTIDSGNLGDCGSKNLGDISQYPWKVNIIHKGIGGWVCDWVEVFMEDEAVLKCDVDQLLDNNNEVTADCHPY